MPSLAEIEELLAAPPTGPALAPLSVAILRNIMLEPIVPYLRFQGRETGFELDVRLGQYDHVVQEALGSGDVWDRPFDVAFVYLWLPALARQLVLEFAAFDEAALTTEVERIERLIETVLGGIRRQSNATIVWHGFEPPAWSPLGIFDRHARQGLTRTVETLNDFTIERLKECGNAYFVDTSACLARVGAERFYDWRYWHVARAPISRRGLEELAAEAFKTVRAARGKARKCLVLDADNVLWGGVIGEDGIDGVKLGPDHPGSAYQEFQQAVLNLHHRGVILALASKNNEADVLEMLDRHPHMKLRREHFASLRINWVDKATNLREIADELNIGLDAVVFADDSEYEIGLVGQQLPQVARLHLPPAQASQAARTILACGLFDTLSLSAEDRQRGAMYRAEACRRELRTSYEDLDQYLAMLGMEVEITLAGEDLLARAAQLTQRTNQFNLTTRRYAESEIRKFIASPAHDVLALRLRDRYGDYGISGLAILAHEPTRTTIDTFLVSCRVLGRGVERALLKACHERAAARGAASTIGVYRSTAKNQQTAEFYPSHGFESLADNGEARSFILPTDRPLAGSAAPFQSLTCRLEN